MLKALFIIVIIVITVASIRRSKARAGVNRRRSDDAVAFPVDIDDISNPGYLDEYEYYDFQAVEETEQFWNDIYDDKS